MPIIKKVTYPRPNIVQIEFDFPQNQVVDVLEDLTCKEVRNFISAGTTFGKIVRLCGELTIGMAVVCGHELSHVCKAIEVFNPKENCFYEVVRH